MICKWAVLRGVQQLETQFQTVGGSLQGRRKLLQDVDIGTSLKGKRAEVFCFSSV
jgi:hypothetical protein